MNEVDAKSKEAATAKNYLFAKHTEMKGNTYVIFDLAKPGKMDGSGNGQHGLGLKWVVLWKKIVYHMFLYLHVLRLIFSLRLIRVMFVDRLAKGS